MNKLEEIRRVALYARVSSQRQAERETPIKAQLAEMREYAAKQGWEVVAEYKDAGKSGRTDDRPEFQEMIATAKKKPKPFDAILVWKFSRFARNFDDSTTHKALLRNKCGIDVKSMKEPIEESAVGKLLERVIQAIDEFYSASLAADCFRGQRDNGKQGYWNGGHIPTGYRSVKVSKGKSEKSTLVPDEKYAPIIERIFDLYLSGMGIKQTAITLNGEGLFMQKGKPWTGDQIGRILKNKVYIGTYVWNQSSNGKYGKSRIKDPDEVFVIEDCFPAIIDKVTFARVQQKLQEAEANRLSPRQEASDYLLSGRLHCGHCGKSFTGAKAKSGKHRYYGCSTYIKSGKDSCAAKLIPVQLLDDAIITRLRDHILTSDNIMTVIERLNNGLAGEENSLRSRLQTIVEELTAAKRRLSNLYDIAEEYGAAAREDLAERIRERRDQIATLEFKRDELQQLLATPQQKLTRDQVMVLLTRLHTVLEKGSFDDKQALVRALVQKITVKEGQVVLKYEFPASNLNAGNDVLALEWIGRAFVTDSKLIREIQLNGVS